MRQRNCGPEWEELSNPLVLPGMAKKKKAKQKRIEILIKMGEDSNHSGDYDEHIVTFHDSRI